VVSPSGARPSESVAKLDGKPYLLASEAQVAALDGVRRRWDVRLVTRQAGDPEAEWAAVLETFSLGYGISYALLPGGYESANGWDLSAPGKARTWPRLATAEALDYGDNVRGWEYYSFATGYFYVLRGAYAVKYLPDPTPGSVWPVIEIHYFGADRVVAGKWAEYNGNVYVPLINPTTDVEEEFEQLGAIADTTAEVQTITIAGTPTAGTYNITFASTTVTLDYNASEAALQTALRTIPGLQKVTVATTGTTPNFTHTVTMTAAPGANGTASPPLMTRVDNTTGGTHSVTVALVTPGISDTWTTGPSGDVARYFAAWEKPGTGPVLALCYENFVRLNGNNPMTTGDWGASYPVDNSTYRINAIAVWDRYLMVGKQNGLYSFDEQAVANLETKDLAGVIDDANFVGMTEVSGFLLCPHKSGLLRWRPGQGRFIGAEQEGLYEGGTALGWGRTVGLTPYGRSTYFSVTDSYNSDGVVGSLIAPGSSARGPLTPHMHHQFSGSAEDIIATTINQSPPRAVDVNNGTDNSAVGTIAWVDPGNIAVTDGAVVATGVGTTHYLKALMPAVSRVPSTATVVGIKVTVDRKANDGFAAITHVGTETVTYANPWLPPSFVIPVPAGTVAGDVLFATVVATGTITTTPAGWTQIAKTQPVAGEDLVTWYRVATASEPANYTITADVGANHGVGTITTRRGVDTGTVLDTTAAAGTAVTSGTTVVAPTQTPVSAPALLVSVFAGRPNSTFSTPTGMTERMDSTDGLAYSMAVDDEVITPAAATGTRTSTFGTTVAFGRAISYTLRPGPLSGA